MIKKASIKGANGARIVEGTKEPWQEFARGK
jgi:hypothetical protein